MAADQLAEVRARVESGEFGLDAELQRAVLARVDDIVATLTSADRALSKLPQPSVSEAAAKMAYLFYISGHGWRRYLTESAQGHVAGAAIEAALRAAIVDVVSALDRAFAARSRLAVTERSPMIYALPCAACDGDAVTLTRTVVSPVTPEQLVVSSLSPVTVFRPVSGSRMGDLLALLRAGDAAAVVRNLRETQPGGCDAFCETCSRVFCRDHYAVEAQWSGSWHESTYVTCPLGHEHEID